MSYTPGPWEVHANAVRTVDVGRCVARLDWEVRDATDDANARLIAAAPELLEALQQMVRQHAAAGQNWRQALSDAHDARDRELAVQIKNGPMVVLNGFPIEAARAAIAKATGAGA